MDQSFVHLQWSLYFPRWNWLAKVNVWAPTKNAMAVSGKWVCQAGRRDQPRQASVVSVGILENEDSKTACYTLLIAVTPLTLGVEAIGGVLTKLFTRGTITCGQPTPKVKTRVDSGRIDRAKSRRNLKIEVAVTAKRWLKLLNLKRWIWILVIIFKIQTFWTLVTAKWSLTEVERSNAGGGLASGRLEDSKTTRRPFLLCLNPLAIT